MDHAFEGVEQQRLPDFVDRIHQNAVDQLILDLFFVVGLFDVFHGEGEVRDDGFDGRVRFKTLIKGGGTD